MTTWPETAFGGRLLPLLVLAVTAACGGAGPSTPTAPTRDGPIVAATLPGGGPLHIEETTQLQAWEQLPDGTRRLVNARWRSLAPAIVAVSATGMATGIGAGEATITAELSSRPGSLQLRVVPRFDGVWSGTEAIMSCEDSGALRGICADHALVGGIGVHHSVFMQKGTDVEGSMDLGLGTITAAAAIGLGGELALPATRVLPADPAVITEVQNWRVRTDVRSQLAGTYDIVFTEPHVLGSVRVRIELQQVSRHSGGGLQGTMRTPANSVGDRVQRGLRD